jgi:hypothetical protein
MPSTCLLDTTIIIDAINDRNRRSQLLDDLLAEGTLPAGRIGFKGWRIVV